MTGDAHDSTGLRSRILLSVRNLRTCFPIRRGVMRRVRGCVRAVDDVSFDIARGTTLGLVGESGCGKTTLGRTILRLIEPVGGTVLMDGVDVLGASRRRLRGLRRHMQLVFQDASGSLDPRMRIGEAVAEPLTVHDVVSGRRREKRVEALLERVGLRAADANRYPHELSGGQRQRVGIARAIAIQPKFLVCDEPVSALDVSIQAKILNLLTDLRRDLGLTYLFIAHNLAVVEHCSDRVAVMYLGKIVEIADAGDLYRCPQHPYTRALLAAVPDPAPPLRRKRVPLSGDVPDASDPPSGCAFHPRCPIATNECHRLTPPLEAHAGLSSGHLVACHHPGGFMPPMVVRENDGSGQG
jgi:oligopeptide/dipeptide ABC transporter ATP-binding protein